MEKNERKMIDPKKAKEMVELYRDFCGRHPEGKLTRSVWFELDKLKKLIDEVLAVAKPGDIPGIRVYFGTYTGPEPRHVNGADVDYKYRNTLIMVPTRRKEGGINEDYDISTLKSFDPLNQGELCPEECGGTDRWGLGG